MRKVENYDCIVENGTVAGEVIVLYVTVRAAIELHTHTCVRVCIKGSAMRRRIHTHTPILTHSPCTCVAL